MYRFIVLACFIGVVQSTCQRQVHPWGPRSGTRPESTPQVDSSAWDIAQSYIALDRKIQYFCHSFASNDLKEEFGIENYMLSASVPGFAEDNISVQVMHRTLYVRAEDCSRTYADVKILPEGVDPKTAVWNYSQGKLLILIPYKLPSVNVQKTCDSFIDEFVMVIPKQTSCEKPESGLIIDSPTSEAGGLIKNRIFRKGVRGNVVNSPSGGDDGLIHNRVFRRGN